MQTSHSQDLIQGKSIAKEETLRRRIDTSAPSQNPNEEFQHQVQIIKNIDLDNDQYYQEAFFDDLMSNSNE